MPLGAGGGGAMPSGTRYGGVMMPREDDGEMPFREGDGEMSLKGDGDVMSLNGGARSP